MNRILAGMPSLTQKIAHRLICTHTKHVHAQTHTRAHAHAHADARTPTPKHAHSTSQPTPLFKKKKSAGTAGEPEHIRQGTVLQEPILFWEMLSSYIPRSIRKHFFGSLSSVLVKLDED